MATGITESTFDEYKSCVIAEAKSDALAFVNEFHESLDPTATDWDSEAWSNVCEHLLRGSGHTDNLWPIYQATLVAETERLCGV